MKKKVGKASDYIVPIGVTVGLIGLGVYLLNKFFGPSGSSQNNQVTTSANTSAASQSQQLASSQGITQTLTPNEAAAIANEVYSLGISAQDSSALYQINSQLDQVNNIADLNAVISAFGTKQIPSGNITSWSNTCLSLGLNCQAVGLGAFVDIVYAAYDSSGNELNILNQYLRDQGINYQF